MPRAAVGVCAIVLLASALLSGAGLQKQDTSATPAAATNVNAVLWRDPGDIASLDLAHGLGGQAHAPDPAATYTFVKEDAAGTSPKFDVVDNKGVAWKVKLGEEPQPETVATRLLWAAGYFVDEDYYVAELTVRELPKLHRGQNYVSGGIVHSARLERKVSGVKKLGNWSWFDNPFAGTREFNGLRVMMSLLNNWDLKDINNSIYDVHGEHRYLISDVGATFGNTGNALTRSKNVPAEFEDSAFIAKASGDFIDFVLHSRPFFLGAVEPHNYSDRTKMESITKHIPRADAKWLGQRLSQLSDAQLRDAFRAAGYGPADIGTLTGVIRRRIAALAAL